MTCLGKLAQGEIGWAAIVCLNLFLNPINSVDLKKTILP